MLGYLTKGGVTFAESDDMTPYERKIALDTIRDYLEEQNKVNEKIINDARSNKSDKSHPKSGLNH